MIKSVDKDHKRVYNIIINQIQGERNNPNKGEPQNEYSHSLRTKSRN